ncbi:hypothetical protein PA598K_04779 [Paenibacillus sp. 598K]|uniref:DUF5693 family protein n=1 Tax=Paenibacillus sp. 598K TaxID=1117987 RepID=UPI000FF97152|nr:DUF5693 family protein [Paenibacillus sp. 598K]GBF76319.1 hypothetical protein PA598K_04779 [Paenibacillus sp. 598K]
MQSIQLWSRRARVVLWALVIAGLIAALPLGVLRYQMEQTSKQVEFVYNYRDLVQIASFQARPQDFIDEQLERMREAGIGTMAVFEATLEELGWSGRLKLYSSAQMAELQGEPAPDNENFTYILYANEEAESTLGPMIESTMASVEIPYRPYTYDDLSGLVVETPLEDATAKTMLPDPLTMQELHDRGFQLLPRLSDRTKPYDPELTDRTLAWFHDLGVKHILFDGDAVKGFADHATDKSLDSMAELLKKYDIGIVAIENLKTMQKGFQTLAYKLDYDVVRLYSLSAMDAGRLAPETIADRFQLAGKDRNIRMFYMNGQPLRSADRGGIVHSLDNIYDSLAGNKDTPGAVKLLADVGYTNGTAEAFKSSYEPGSWMKLLKGVVALGAIAIIALLIGAFVPVLLLPVFVLGLIGSAGLYVLSPALLEQGLALGAGVASPTLALIWVFGRIRKHTEGDRRVVGGEWSGEGDKKGGTGMFDGKWVFPELGKGRRLTMAIGLYVLTAIISLVSVPLIIGLLNSISYSLVLQQYRGVSVLHLAPIALTSLYVFLYSGSPLDNLRRLLRMRITVLSVMIAGVLGVVGMYYLSRTGNAGSVSGIELTIRSLLEGTFGVRPRFKEFMFAHPLFLLGLFLALRYRAAWVLIIVASIGQLSIVDTFAHIHTPLYISFIRVVLGLGVGAIIGLALIVAWQIGEGVWRRWAMPLIHKKRTA